MLNDIISTLRIEETGFQEGSQCQKPDYALLHKIFQWRANSPST